MSTHPSSGWWYGVTGHVIGPPRRSIVVYSVVTKRSKTSQTCVGRGLAVIPGDSTSRAARFPQSEAGLARGPRPGAEHVREVHVRRDRQRLRITVLDQQAVQHAPVRQPHVREQPAVAVSLLDTDPIADARSERQQALGELGRLAPEALRVAV